MEMIQNSFSISHNESATSISHYQGTSPHKNVACTQTQLKEDDREVHKHAPQNLEHLKRKNLQNGVATNREGSVGAPASQQELQELQNANA